MTSFHAVFGSLISAACFFGTCTGIFTTVITLINGIPVTAAEAGASGEDRVHDHAIVVALPNH